MTNIFKKEELISELCILKYTMLKSSFNAVLNYGWKDAMKYTSLKWDLVKQMKHDKKNRKTILIDKIKRL